MLFSFRTKVKLYDTDAAGIIYFASQFRFVHDAWESYLNEKGVFIEDMMRSTDYMFVIAHVEADYKMPVFLGDELEVRLSITRVGRSSATISYDLYRGEDLVGTAKTVHVAIEVKTRQKIDIPEELRLKFG